MLQLYITSVYKRGKSGHRYRLNLYPVNSELPPKMAICILVRIERGKKPKYGHREATSNLSEFYSKHPFQEEIIAGKFKYVAVYIPKQTIGAIKFYEKEFMNGFYHKFQGYNSMEDYKQHQPIFD